MTEPTYMTAVAIHAALTEITDAFKERYPGDNWDRPYASISATNIGFPKDAKIRLSLNWTKPRIDGKTVREIHSDGIMPAIVEMLAWVKSHKSPAEAEEEKTAQLADCLGVDMTGTPMVTAPAGITYKATMIFDGAYRLTEDNHIPGFMKGDIVYRYTGATYGLCGDDARAFGEEFWPMTIGPNNETPFHTVPVRILEKVKP